MWHEVRGVVTDAFQDLLWRWRSLALTDIACKLVTFALLTPATALIQVRYAVRM